MARRRQKRRTHVAANSGLISDGGQTSSSPASRVPKSMVIRVGAGDVGPSVSQLVKDFRQMMEPHTASRLRERRSNKLRDFTTMAGPLGVSHLLLFSRSENGNVSLRLALTPRGPTMHFRVESYSLCKDVRRAMKRPTGTSKEFTAPPLLVMNNFATSKENETSQRVPKHLESLSTSIFQSLFPAISPAVTPLTSIQRVLLLNRETADLSHATGSYILHLRHYSVGTRRVGLPRTIRRINAAEKVLLDRNKRKRSVPNLGKLDDVADYLLDTTAGGGFTSGSESEPETDAEVEMLDNRAQKLPNRKKTGDLKQIKEQDARVERRAIKLSELGPRLKLRLIKIEEGVCTGKVMWHESIKKSKEEEQQQDEAWERRNRAREERRKQQKENIARKGKVYENNRPDDNDEDAIDEDDWDSEASDDLSFDASVPATHT